MYPVRIFSLAVPTVWYDENISAIFDQQMITATHLPFGWPELRRWRTVSTVRQDETTPNYEKKSQSQDQGREAESRVLCTWDRW
jgi:hypothetical protein